MLKNLRHEAFAQALARGVVIHLAYVEAGFDANSGNASRLNANPKVIERVAQLRALVSDMQKRSTAGVVLTEQWIIEQLIGVTIDARSGSRPDSAGANKALHLLGLHMGMFIERKETGKPGEFDNLTIAAKRERVQAIAKQLGLIPQSVVDVPLDDIEGPLSNTSE